MKQLFLLAIDKIKPGEIGYTPTATDPNNTIGAVLTVTYTWAGIICVIVIIVAGIFYTTSAANPSHTKRAREAIIYAFVGLIVILMAFVITQFVLGRFA